ncbi:hypothetical protein [Streptomyces tauricus]|uniref:hypothetical protein n=1 Tax=Streptomyces tauricus TaxID=68274 RepID=UPI002243CF77|nr:hypothetical protein [Streptomyces tauricus]MCW8103003.1 hypothetical protein [Streptomyces tauricus]
MTRTPPSALEQMLVAEVAKCGVTASPHQIERWRGQLWLAPAAQWSDPATGGIRPEIVHRAAWLALLSRTGRSISWMGWSFWAIDESPETTRRLRDALTRTLQLPFRQAGMDITQIPEGDDDDAFTTRQAMAAELLAGRRDIGRDLDGILRAHADAAGISLPAPRSVTNPFAKGLVEVGARLMVGGMEDVSPEELTEAWGSVWAGSSEQIEQIGAAHIAAGRDGVDLHARSPLASGLRGLVRAVEGSDDRLLCAAVRACTKGTGVLLKLLMERAADEPEILVQLMDDVMWDEWVRVGGVAPVGRLGEAAITLSTVQYLLVPGWAEDLERYVALMEGLFARSVLTRPSSDPAHASQDHATDGEGPMR